MPLQLYKQVTQLLLNYYYKLVLLKKSEHLYSTLPGTNHLKALRHGSQLLICKEHYASLYLVSVHQWRLH